jgi:hypothetical protein
MSVGTYKIEIHQGETWALEIDVKDNNDEPMNLSEYSAKMQFRDSPGGKIYATLESGDEITITGATGNIKCKLSSDETAALKLSRGVHDLYIKTGSNVTYLLKGEVEVTRRVTE